MPIVDRVYIIIMVYETMSMSDGVMIMWRWLCLSLCHVEFDSHTTRFVWATSDEIDDAWSGWFGVVDAVVGCLQATASYAYEAIA